MSQHPTIPENVSKVFIIGNGFDLNLGLPTSYHDFINSELFKNYLDVPIFKQIQTQSSISKWVDIEAELINISQNTKEENFHNQYKLLCQCLSNYIQSIKINSLNHESHAYRLIKERYSFGDSYVATFNYTHSIEFILEELHVKDGESLPLVNHVHGDCINGSIIFGVDDKAGIKDEHAFLYKSTYNNDGGRDLKTALSNADEIYFFGHSLGASDHMYFQRLFSDLYVGITSNKKLNFYHYGESGLIDLHMQLQTLTGRNLSKMKSNCYFKTYDTSIERTI